MTDFVARDQIPVELEKREWNSVQIGLSPPWAYICPWCSAVVPIGNLDGESYRSSHIRYHRQTIDMTHA